MNAKKYHFFKHMVSSVDNPPSPRRRRQSEKHLRYHDYYYLRTMCVVIRRRNRKDPTRKKAFGSLPWSSILIVMMCLTLATTTITASPVSLAFTHIRRRNDRAILVPNFDRRRREANKRCPPRSQQTISTTTSTRRSPRSRRLARFPDDNDGSSSGERRREILPLGDDLPPAVTSYVKDVCPYDVEADGMLSLPEDYDLLPDVTLPKESDIVVIDKVIRWVPLYVPILGFLTYETVAQIFDRYIEIFSFNNWYAVDGKAFQTQIITPVINGIVLPSITILFATLISNTFATLRQRQIDIRTNLNSEANEIRLLQTLVNGYPINPSLPVDDQDKCRYYLTRYVDRLIAESQPGIIPTSNISTDSEVTDILRQLNFMIKCTDPPHPTIVSESYGALQRLNACRVERLSTIQTTFPPLHYAILATLAGAICTCFLMESNQELLIFLNAFQLKILWTMLVGTFSALSVVCYDLNDPFRGSYQISLSVKQLYSIKESLQDAEEKKKKKYHRLQ